MKLRKRWITVYKASNNMWEMRCAEFDGTFEIYHKPEMATKTWQEIMRWVELRKDPWINWGMRF